MKPYPEFWFQSEQEVNVSAGGSAFKVQALICPLACDKEVPNALTGTQVRQVACASTSPVRGSNAAAT